MTDNTSPADRDAAEQFGPREQHYNLETYYREVNASARRHYRDCGPRVGTLAPAFQLPLVDGGLADSQALLAQGHLVLLFGCLSAPPCLVQLPALEALWRERRGQGYEFLFVYTREIHPGELLPPHHSLEQKLAQARQLRDYAGLTFPVCADDLAGTVHRAYGELPAMAAVVHRSGTLVYRGEWIQAEQLHNFLDNLAARDRAGAGGRAGRLSYNEALTYMESESAEQRASLLSLAGRDAVEDAARAGSPDHPL